MHLVALLHLGIDLLRFVRADLSVRVAHDVDDLFGDVAETDLAAHFNLRLDLFGLVERPLGLRILDLVLVLHYFLDHKHLHAAAGAVDDRLHRLASLVVLACSGGQGVFQRLEDALDVDRLLVRQRFDVLAQIFIKHGGFRSPLPVAFP